MSRIFDALQRAERERSGTDGAELPQGPELLRHAEQFAAAQWDTDGTLTAYEGSVMHDGVQTLEPLAAHADLVAALAAPSPERVSEKDQEAVFSTFPDVRMSLSPQSRLVCLTDRESPTAEALRLLGVRLRDVRRTRNLKKLLITSTIPQEGKSTIAANLACTLAHATKERVLLLEGDLRRPSLAHMFGLQRLTGISECLRSDTGSLSGIYQVEGAGLWILPAGTAPSNPLELLQSPRLGALMNRLAAHFDWIVIDSPPVLPLADASIWMRLADGILLVTRQGTTEKQQLKKGLAALDPNKVLGALLNGSIASAYSGYYYRSSPEA
jgi:capsular exopolysaccharide synthesis family protein